MKHGVGRRAEERTESSEGSFLTCYEKYVAKKSIRNPVSFKNMKARANVLAHLRE